MDNALTCWGIQLEDDGPVGYCIPWAGNDTKAAGCCGYGVNGLVRVDMVALVVGAVVRPLGVVLYSSQNITNFEIYFYPSQKLVLRKNFLNEANTNSKY